MRTPHLALLGAALLAGALTVACSDDDSPLAETESIDSSTGTTQTTEDGVDSETGGEPRSEPGSGGSDEVIGTGRATLPAGPLDDTGLPMRIDVLRLERHGDLVELTLALANEAEATGDEPPGFTINDMFGDEVADYDASGIGLVDGDAQKLYLPVLDSDGSCLCTSDFGSNDVAAGSSRTITATYGGVPDDVEALDVQVPSFPTIAGVPLR
jgi:hypothetical protein